MSTATLRDAARLMRERARSALRDLPEQRWKPGPTIDPDNNGWYVSSDIPEADWDTTVAHLPYDYEGDAAPHIASWHPDVALAVADWLETVADAGTPPGDVHHPTIGRSIHDADWTSALAVARAYLGESA